MNYCSVVEPGIQTIIRKQTTYFASADVTRGDYSVLDSGGVYFCVLRPGPFGEEEKYGSALQIREMSTMVELYKRYVHQASDYTDFCAMRDAVVGELEKWPSLDSTAGINLVRCAADGPAEEVFDDEGEGPFYIYQELRVRVVVRSTVTGGEYA